MNQYSSNNKRIAKNSLYLYIRMFVIMAVSLYTTRVILKVLGASDYGVFDVMGGIIGILGYVNMLLAGGTSRFLTIDLGRGDMKELKNTFAMCNTLALTAGVIILILGETIGLWFMESKLNINPERIDAAMWVYQCALFSSVFSVFSSPYMASIIAHEKMSVYAYMSIIEAVLKLAIVFLLFFFNVDKLKLYAFLLFLTHLVVFILYAAYSLKKFEECTVKCKFNKEKIAEMLTFSGWGMIGALAYLLNNYGISILLNIFFGTVVNAARGIAVQINTVIQKFYTNFQTAARPQIVKYYAQNDIVGMSNLINNTSKYSGFLLLCLIVPIVAGLRGLLTLWLSEFPKETAFFVICLLSQSLLTAIDLPVGQGIMAVGKMKLPNITTAILNLSVFPLTYFAFKMGANPTAGYLIYILSSPFVLIVDLWILNKYIGFNRTLFFRRTLLPVICLSIAGLAPALLVSYRLIYETWIGSILIVLCSFLWMAILIFFFGLSKTIRYNMIRIMREKLSIIKTRLF